METDLYIPLFKTNIGALQKEFVRQYYPKLFKKIFCYDNDEENHISFMKFIEIEWQEDAWHDFKTKKLLNDAILWYTDNGLPYTYRE